MKDINAQAKISQFINDQRMSGAVYDALLSTFLKKKGGEDVNTKAARFIAVELLNEAWVELSKEKLSGVEEEKPITNKAL